MSCLGESIQDIMIFVAFVVTFFYADLLARRLERLRFHVHYLQELLYMYDEHFEMQPVPRKQQPAMARSSSSPCLTTDEPTS